MSRSPTPTLEADTVVFKSVLTRAPHAGSNRPSRPRTTPCATLLLHLSHIACGRGGRLLQLPKRWQFCSPLLKKIHQYIKKIMRQRSRLSRTAVCFVVVVWCAFSRRDLTAVTRHISLLSHAVTHTQKQNALINPRNPGVSVVAPPLL